MSSIECTVRQIVDEIIDICETEVHILCDESDSTTSETKCMNNINSLNRDAAVKMSVDVPAEVHPSEQIEFSECCENEPEGIKIPYDFNDIPVQLTGAWSAFDEKNNYTKGCKWSPDGLCLLTNSEDSCLRLFNLPDQLYLESFSFELFCEMEPVLSMQEAELIYDYCWFPKMSSGDPDSCFFVSSSANNPIHMWDAFSGQLRCTYRAYNSVDEISPAYSLAFNSQGSKLYCGFNKMIRIFDVAIPGRDFEQRPTVVKKQGQSGIVSCLAVSPADEQIYAAGSYSRSIGIYTEPKGKLLFMLQGQLGGLTHLQFSNDGTKLYSGGRKDPEILCWDLRNPGQVLYSMKRDVTTNQRIYFDLDRCCQFAASGNQDGTISIWDVDNRTDDVESVVVPSLNYRGHDDCVNGVSFHPSLPLLASCSGQRKFEDPVSDTESIADDDDDDAMFTSERIVVDNSLRLWWFGKNRQCQ
ncbi:WRAP53 (predicted) [Pycnogonum litorale]